MIYKKKSIALVAVIFLSVLFIFSDSLIYSSGQYKVLDNKFKIKKVPVNMLKQFKADVAIVGLISGPCMCQKDLLKYHHVISPKNMSVYIFNNSNSLNVNVKVTVKYFSLSRSPGKWKVLTKSVLLKKNRKIYVNFWLNTYYDLIKISGSKKIYIKLEITDKNIIDPNLSNNSRVSTDCEYYIQ